MTKRILGAACICAAMFVFTGCPDDKPSGTDGGVSSKDACTPKCDGKTCGDDGCGGTCSPGCTGDQVCENGQCKCVPNCDGKVCGDDGCGGSCAPGCAANQECTAEGTCQIKICVPNCAGKDCGADGCGGFCGANRGGCPEGKACSVNSKCELCTAQCATGQECGEDAFKCSCGSCAAGKTCDTTASPAVCVSCTPKCTGKTCGDDGCGGTCGSCGSGTGCSAEGQCVTCTPGAECVGKTCGADAKGCSCGSCTGGKFCQRDGTCGVCQDTGGSVTIDTLCTKLDGGLKKWAAWNYQMCGMVINDADPAQLNSADIDHLDAEFYSWADYGYVYPVGPYNEIHSCQYWFKETYEALKASAQAGHVCFDSKAVDECIQAGLDAKKLNEYGYEPPAVCGKFFVANQTEGKSCNYQWECVEGTYCRPTDDKLSCGGLCAVPLPLGSPCGENDRCAVDTACTADETTGATSCVSLPKDGEACPDYVCVTGFVCSYDDGQICVAEATKGQTCVVIDYYYGQANCASGLECVDGTGAECVQGATCTCVEPAPAPDPGKFGDACNDNTPCGYCLFCNPDTSKCDKPTKIGDACLNIQSTDLCVAFGPVQECDSATKTCVIKPREGAACYVDPNETDSNGNPVSMYIMRQGNCMYTFDNYCKRDTPAETGVCAALPKKGEPCNDSFNSAAYCQSGYCKGYTAPNPVDGTGGVDGTCTDYEADGAPCGLYADPGTGDTCTTAADCDTGEVCPSGTCTLPACALDTDCPAGDVCRSTVCMVVDAYICDSSTCIVDPVNGNPVCGSPAKAGNACAQEWGSNAGSLCADDSYCAIPVTDAGAGPGLCVLKKAGGEACEKAAECQTGNCNADKVCAFDCGYSPGADTDGCGDYTGFNWWAKYIFVSGTLVFFGLRRRRKSQQ